MDPVVLPRDRLQMAAEHLEHELRIGRNRELWDFMVDGESDSPVLVESSLCNH